MIEKIKKIRELTGAGVVDIKKALDKADGNESVAIEILKSKGLEKAEKKIDRKTQEGTIGFYVHSTGKIASWVKVYCETDFVARNKEFQQLAKDLAMQIAGMSPLEIKQDDISEEVISTQKKYWEEEIKKSGKPEELIKKIISGKESKFRREHSLLGQIFVKNQEINVEEHLKGMIAKLGENIQIGEFGRTEL